MPNLWKSLQGKRTYLAALAIAIVVFLEAAGFIDQETALKLEGALGAVALATLRAGVARHLPVVAALLVLPFATGCSGPRLVVDEAGWTLTTGEAGKVELVTAQVCYEGAEISIPFATSLVQIVGRFIGGGDGEALPEGRPDVVACLEQTEPPGDGPAS